jgi:hypothetical protein
MGNKGKWESLRKGFNKKFNILKRNDFIWTKTIRSVQIYK